jgi:hypothetical protein
MSGGRLGFVASHPCARKRRMDGARSLCGKESVKKPMLAELFAFYAGAFTSGQ